MPQRHRMELSESVSGEPLTTYRRSARTFRAGRTCVVDGCSTVLSIYNSAKHCAAHQDHRFRTRGRRASDVELEVSPPTPVTSAVA